MKRIVGLLAYRVNEFFFIVVLLSLNHLLTSVIHGHIGTTTWKSAKKVVGYFILILSPSPSLQV